MQWVQTEAVPAATWVGFGDDRRYLLAHDDVSGLTYAWFRTGDGWGHTLDPSYPSQTWSVHEPAEPEVLASLVDHLRNIESEGCEARGWCRVHDRTPGQ